MRSWILSLSVALLAGCSLTLPVEGSMEDGGETFTGTATGYSDGGGNLAVTSNKGMTCNGDFTYITSRFGKGIFRCSNGQSGPFEFTSTGRRGNGVGRLGDRRFTFTFG